MSSLNFIQILFFYMNFNSFGVFHLVSWITLEARIDGHLINHSVQILCLIHCLQSSGPHLVEIVRTQ